MDTHPSDKASNIIDASSRVKPVPPKSSLPNTELKKIKYPNKNDLI